MRYSGGTIWHRDEIHFGKLRRYDPTAGKTGKGILHFWEAPPAGKYRAVDVEDIIGLTVTSLIRRR